MTPDEPTTQRREFDPRVRSTINYDRMRGAGPAGSADAGEPQRSYRCSCRAGRLEWRRDAWECMACGLRSKWLPSGATTGEVEDGDVGRTLYMLGPPPGED